MQSAILMRWRSTLEYGPNFRVLRSGPSAPAAPSCMTMTTVPGNWVPVFSGVGRAHARSLAAICAVLNPGRSAAATLPDGSVRSGRFPRRQWHIDENRIIQPLIANRKRAEVFARPGRAPGVPAGASARTPCARVRKEYLIRQTPTGRLGWSSIWSNISWASRPRQERLLPTTEISTYPALAPRRPAGRPLGSGSTGRAGGAAIPDGAA